MKTKRIVILIMGLLLINTIKAENNILIIGDSLSAAYGLTQKQSWVYLLQQRLDNTYPHYQIINDSISGDTTANGLIRLPQALLQSQPEIVIIELGANDGLRGLPVSFAKKNLQKIIQTIQQKQVKILLLGMQIPPNYGQKYTQAIAALYPQLAEQYQLTLVPFMLAGISGNTSLIQADGLHPNAQAQALIVENIWPYLKPILKP
jgi:acyl-CoA thioesterase I